MNPAPVQADLLIHPRWLVPVEPEGTVLAYHSLAVTGGAISAIVPRADTAGIAAKQTVELPDHVLLPGLINSHGHAAMSLLRGYADDLPLTPWLEDHIWPAEAAQVDAHFVRDGVRLALVEMLCTGTTTCSDMYFFPEAAAREYLAAGMRCQVAFPVFDFASVWGSGADDYISKGLALHDEYRHSDLVNIVFGPHAPYTVSEKNLARIGTLANELDLPIHMHLHETRSEVQQAVAASQERPLATLNRLGLLGPRMQCVHMTDVADEDLELLSATGAHVVHCPQSNMKLASGICPVHRLRDAGVNLALGTDSAASNNSLNLFLEMRAAALLAKLGSGNAAVLPAQAALSMATIGGARALGIDDRCGSLLPGKQADMIAVDLSAAATQPVYNPLSTLVYACNGSEVSHSWVGGEALLADRQLTKLDAAAVTAQARVWQARIAGANNPL